MMWETPFEKTPALRVELNGRTLAGCTKKPWLRFPAPQKGREQKAPKSFQARLVHCQHSWAMEVHFFTAVQNFSAAEGIWRSDEFFHEALFGLIGWLIMKSLFSYFWVWRIFLYSEYSSFIRYLIWQYFSQCAIRLFFPSVRVGDGTQGLVMLGRCWTSELYLQPFSFF